MAAPALNGGAALSGPDNPPKSGEPRPPSDEKAACGVRRPLLSSSNVDALSPERRADLIREEARAEAVLHRTFATRRLWAVAMNVLGVVLATAIEAAALLLQPQERTGTPPPGAIAAIVGAGLQLLAHLWLLRGYLAVATSARAVMAAYPTTSVLELSQPNGPMFIAFLGVIYVLSVTLLAQGLTFALPTSPESPASRPHPALLASLAAGVVYAATWTAQEVLLWKSFEGADERARAELGLPSQAWEKSETRPGVVLQRRFRKWAHGE